MQGILTIFENFLLILVSILVFISPFYYLYKRKNTGSIKSHGISREIEGFAQSQQANYLVFFWALADGLFWFVIPEFLLLLLIFMRIRRKGNLLIYNLFGTIAGTILAYVINLPAHLLQQLPYIQPSMIQQCAVWFENSGIFALAHLPFSGVPYKVFVNLAPNYSILFATFIVAAVLARVAIYYVFYFLLDMIYPLLHRYVYRNYVYLFFVAVFIFTLIFMRVYNSYDASGTTSFNSQKIVLVQKPETV
jgi:hypothetical protein